MATSMVLRPRNSHIWQRRRQRRRRSRACLAVQALQPLTLRILSFSVHDSACLTHQSVATLPKPFPSQRTTFMRSRDAHVNMKNPFQSFSVCRILGTSHTSPIPITTIQLSVFNSSNVFTSIRAQCTLIAIF